MARGRCEQISPIQCGQETSAVSRDRFRGAQPVFAWDTREIARADLGDETTDGGRWHDDRGEVIVRGIRFERAADEMK